LEGEENLATRKRVKKTYVNKPITTTFRTKASARTVQSSLDSRFVARPGTWIIHKMESSSLLHLSSLSLSASHTLLSPLVSHSR